MSSGILSVEEVALKYGLDQYTTCNCNGYFTRKWFNNTYTLHWRTEKYVFKLMKRNDTVKDWTPVGQLMAYMKTYFDGEKESSAV